MSKLPFALIALCVSCHAPSTAAQYLPTQSESDTSQTRLTVATPEPAPVRVVEPSGRPKAREDATEDDVRLCCDGPTKLCWLASGEECTGASSYERSCAPLAVREVSKPDGIVVCAD